MSDIKISVIIPMYNREKYIVDAITSVLNQTFQDFEIIILDDFSTDNSCQMVESISDCRIKLIKFNEKSGIAKLRNYGNKLAKGKYISVFDSDDIMPDYRLKIQYNYMESHPDIGVLGGGIMTIGEDDDYIVRSCDSEIINIGLLYHTMVCHGTSLIRKDILEKYQINYNTDYPYAEDWALWVDMINKVKMMNLDCNLLFYRRHNDSITVETRSDPIKMDIRQKKMSNIFKTALDNFEFKLSEEEVELFILYNSEYNQHGIIPDKNDYKKMKALLQKMAIQANDLGINKEKFIEISNEWIEEKAYQYQILIPGEFNI